VCSEKRFKRITPLEILAWFPRIARLWIPCVCVEEGGEGSEDVGLRKCVVVGWVVAAVVVVVVVFAATNREKRENGGNEYGEED
jgi:hypothetical protein